MKTIKYLKLKGKKEIKTMKRIMLGSNGPGMREKERKKKTLSKDVDKSFKRISCHLEK